MNIRTSTGDDLAAIVALFHESVHGIAAQSYTPEQLRAWAPDSPSLDEWQTRLGAFTTLVAECRGILAGFISYSDTGHIGFLFTSPAFARSGVGSRLYDAAVQRLLATTVTTLTTEASIEARPFFESKGFTVTAQQTVKRNGVELIRFAMTKTFGPD